jgi:hypothetical protein
LLTSLPALTDSWLLLCLGIVRGVVPRAYEFWIVFMQVGLLSFTSLYVPPRHYTQL